MSPHKIIYVQIRGDHDGAAESGHRRGGGGQRGHQEQRAHTHRALVPPSPKLKCGLLWDFLKAAY